MKNIHSIRWRLVASYLFLTALTVAVVGVLALSLVKRYTDRQEAEYLQANAEAVARRAEMLLWLPNRQMALQELAQTAAFLGNAQVKILDDKRQILADSGPQSVGDRFIWIAAAPPFLAGRADVTRFEFHSMEGVPPLHANGPRPRAISLMVLPGAEAGDTQNDLEWKQLPPGTEYTTGRLVGDVWGGRIIFDDVGIVEAVPITTTSPPHFAHKFVRTLPGGDQFAVRVKSLDADRAEQAQTKIKLSQDNRSDRTLVVSIGDPQAPQAFVELSNGPNFGDEAVATTSRAFVLAGFGAMLLAVLIGLFVSRDLTAPLSRLTTTATRMSNGDLAVRAPVLGQDEFGQLAQQFNRMAERLEESFTELAAERDALRRFIADASHELRTPITALKNFNELLQNAAADDPAAQTEFLQESEGQIKRLEWITHNLLNLSRFDAGLVELDLAEHDLGTILTDLASSFRTQVQEKQIKLTVHLPEPPIVLACDRPRLELALANLLENGLRFVPPGGHIDLDLKVSSITDSHAGEVVQLQVRDDGAGIDPTDLPHIFERFYRGRNNPSVGSGLGLAIVKTIIQAHQGRVAVESRLGEGSRFLIELPLSPSSAGLSAQN